MDEAGLPRRERERQAHRSEIMRTALELFSQRGFHNVSMQEIAHRAEFAVGTLYNFFKDKEDLYKALVLEQAAMFDNELNKAIDSTGEEIEKIRSYIRAKGEVFSANIPMIRLYFMETQGVSFNIKAGLELEIRERYEVFLRKVAAVFESGIRKQKFQNLLDPYYMAVALDSLTNAFLFLWLEDPEQHPYSRNVDAIVKLFFEKLEAS